MTKPPKLFLLKTVCKEIWQQFVVTGYAAIYYCLCVRKKGIYDVVICSHIGDFLFAAGYAEALKKEKQIRKLRLVGDQKFAKLLAYYPDLDCDYKALKQGRLQVLLDANRNRIGRAFFQQLGSISIVEPANGFLDGFVYAFRFPELNLKNCVKYGSLGLSKNSDFIRPSYKAGQKRTSNKKKVMLCPFAQVMNIPKIEQYMELLAEGFLKAGYVVYINEMWHGILDNRIKQVRWGLDVFFEKCFEIECVIGIRSGLLDLAVCTSAAVVALYPKGSGLNQFYDLNLMDPEKKNNFQYILTNDLQKDVEEILSLCI